jgi:hypothetical protein
MKRAVALLLTLMFIIVITATIGYGLKQLNNSMQKVDDEKFMYQNVAIANDVINILKKSKDIKALQDKNATDEFHSFLSDSAFIPLTTKDMQIKISLSSARGKFNPNIIATNIEARDYLREFLNNNYMVEYNYVDVLLDNMISYKSKKEKTIYNTDIFDKNPSLFRKYIASKEHLNQINKFYKQENDKNLDKIPFNNLFYYSKDINMAIDLNYASIEVWEFMLGIDKMRAEELYKNEGTYHSLKDLNLDDEEKKRLSKFKISFYEPYILVNIFTQKDKNYAHISFEYDIKKEKVSHFVFEI